MDLNIFKILSMLANKEQPGLRGQQIDAQLAQGLGEQSGLQGLQAAPAVPAGLLQLISQTQFANKGAITDDERRRAQLALRQ